MSNKKKILFIIFGLCVFLLIIVSVFVLFSTTNFDENKRYIYVRKEAKIPDNILLQIDTGHLIHNFAIFKILAGATDIWSHVKPGRFEIKKGESIFSLVQKFRQNQQCEVRLVINKLRVTEDFAKLIGKNFSTDSLTAVTYLNNNKELKKFGVDSSLLTSIIIPNTYFFNWTATLDDILKRLKNEYDKFWQKEDRKQKAASLGLSPLEIITIASIVEEETNKNDEKGNIASVYINRYNKGMALGADPTIKFALKNFKLNRILFGDLRVQSPYNTYLNKGLPPGPICTPQPLTIDAVLNSPRTDYLFFVADSSFNGYHHFSNNFAEHDRFAKYYQKALTILMERKKVKADTLNNNNK